MQRWAWAKRIQWPSLKARVVVLSLGLLVLGVGVHTLVSTQLLQDDLQNLLGEQQFAAVTLVAEEIDHELADRMSALHSVAASLAPELHRPGALQALLEQRPLLLRLFNGGVFITGPDGTAVVDVPRTAGRLGVNYMDRETVSVPLREGRPLVGRPSLGKKLGAPIFSLAVPLRDAQGRPSGVIVGTINLGVPNFLDAVVQRRYGKAGGYLVIAPQHGLFVTASDRSRILQPLPDAGVNRMHDRYMQGFEGYGVARSSRGVVELSAAKRVATSGWFVVATRPVEEVYAPIGAMQQRLVSGSLVLLVLGAGVIWWALSALLRREFAPMVALAQHLAQVSPSVHQPLPQPLPVARQDELGDLVAGFNTLLQRLAQREAALQASELRLHALIDAAPDAILTLDAAGRIVQINAAGLHLLQAQSAAAVLGLRLSDRAVPGDRHSCVAWHRRVLAGESVEWTFELTGLQGDHRRAQAHAVPLHDAHGLQQLVVLRDVTHTEREQAQLRQLSRIAEQAPLSILITDLSGRIEYVNPFFTQKTGYTQAEVLGRNPRLLQSGHTHPDVHQELWRTLTAQRVWRGELSNRSKTGALFIERVVIAPVVGASGRVSHYVALKEDVTDEQHAQQARLAQSQRIEELSRHLVHAQEQTRSRFARELHDRTSPNLAVLRINLDILAHALQRPPRPGEPSLADRIDDTRAVIEDTNASIREICAGLHPAAIERGGLLVAVRDHAQQWARRTGIAVQVQGPDDAARLPPDLELALFRVVQEALANCAKHAQAHTVHIAMQWAQRPITLSIADDGRGFDPATTTGASGLGLVTMRETAEFVGGQLTITSTPGHGTRISVEIADVSTSESLQK